MGLHIMNYRAGMIGGTLEVRPDQVEGTTVSASFRCTRRIRTCVWHMRANTEQGDADSEEGPSSSSTTIPLLRQGLPC